jgi:8-oxo-dGTP pyrophosphatase MutT (NUDIX family)
MIAADQTVERTRRQTELAVQGNACIQCAQQACAGCRLPWRIRKGEVQVCLVTSRGTGRWILPKGWPEKDLSHAEAAAREAWEEAGLKGSADPEPCGEFDALKGVDED